MLFRLITCFWCLTLGLLVGVYQFALYLIGNPTDPTFLVLAAGLFAVGLVMAASIGGILENRIDAD